MGRGEGLGSFGPANFHNRFWQEQFVLALGTSTYGLVSERDCFPCNIPNQSRSIWGLRYKRWTRYNTSYRVAIGDCLNKYDRPSDRTTDHRPTVCLAYGNNPLDIPLGLFMTSTPRDLPHSIRTLPQTLCFLLLITYFYWATHNVRIFHAFSWAEQRFYPLSASKAIFRVRAYSHITYSRLNILSHFMRVVSSRWSFFSAERRTRTADLSVNSRTRQPPDQYAPVYIRPRHELCLVPLTYCMAL